MTFHVSASRSWTAHEVGTMSFSVIAGLAAITTIALTILQAQGKLPPASNYISSTVIPLLVTLTSAGVAKILYDCKNSVTSDDIRGLRAKNEAIKDSEHRRRREDYDRTQRGSASGNFYKSLSEFEGADRDISEQNVKTVATLDWKPKEISSKEAMHEMWQNSEDLITSKIGEPGYLSNAQRGRALPQEDDFEYLERYNQPLTFESATYNHYGTREEMEDVSLFQEIDEGTLMGVFDGHGGSQVAEFAKERFAEDFSTVLKKNDGNVFEAFEQMVVAINEGIEAEDSLKKEGATAVISFIDKDTDLIYTATLGDCEAHIYREIDGKRVAIPLSVCKDWSQPEEAARAAIRMNRPDINNKWVNNPNPKELQYPPDVATGINASRGFGDAFLNSLGKNHEQFPGKAISSKPEISVNKLKKGDIVLLTSDGITDFINQIEIVDIIDESSQDSFGDCLIDIAEAAYDQMRDERGDNATIVGIEIN